jgi:rhamnosyltransferase subunit B
MANVLLLTWDSGGDVVPMMRIGGGLKARGHTVTLVANSVYQGHARQADLNFAALDSLEEAEQFLGDLNRLARPLDVVRYFRQRLLPRLPRYYETIRQRERPGETILVSFDMSRIVGQPIAEKLNAPFVLLYSAPKHVKYGFGRFTATQSGLDEATALLFEARSAVGLPAHDDLAAWERGVASRLGHWPEWFGPPGHDLPFGVEPIGFLFDRSDHPLPNAVQAFLETGTRPVLITHGTSAPQDPRFFRASIEACRRLGLRALLVTQRAELLPQLPPERAAWFRYVPYGSLMPRVRAVIHHGGIATCGVAMRAGIPQLLLPAGLDRRDNALNLRRLGIADLLPPAQWHPETIAATLAHLVASPAIQVRCRQLASRVQAADPVASACDLIEAALVRKSPLLIEDEA